MIYLLLKAAHVASITVFVGGLLVLSIGIRIPNLVVQRAVLQWDRRATLPALALVWASGVTIALLGHWFGDAWLTVKLVLVTALSALHGILAGSLRRMARDDANVASVWRHAGIGSGIVAAAAVVIVLVVVKPF
ncbi:CopD family protein [Burkholderia oklahomensis]|uniref:CopD family protein n=1 Tax=Burkholderia oklahomensis TaxID=342113 RepID=UPI0003165636|nr:CopD family protein [Burkholderia oklahomensis]AJX35841.1 hypothetical protein BG90_3845 [Burkholderia oklahomensis C6786]AOI50321.1 hypothetical protein WI23_29740 [Burkholderia oklahomensis C6786]KUY47334.1 hypothetical protein WI23_30015 [Burkholderia oklahomensis C6786]MBI0364252.1 CopD family protein [Burkholderia oklahomensis]MDN7670977.1 CopD family protein [Burkholderia oklahomensis]